MPRHPVKTLIVIVGLSFLTACTPRASEGTMNSDNPASRLYAIQRAGEERDASAVPQLVESLDSDDPAVRMMAILALEKITGTRRGYDPYAPAMQRHAAVEAWREAVESGNSPTATVTDPPATASNPPVSP